jgi:dihydrofolate reductase
MDETSKVLGYTLSMWGRPVRLGFVGRKQPRGGIVRKVVVSEFVSLDGIIEDPGGSGELDRGGWSFQFDRGTEGNEFKFDELASADALLLGRLTYEGFASAWPQMEEQTGEYGAWMNGYPKYVVSRTLQEPLEWNNSTLIEGDLAEGVSRLKQQEGKDILVFGSGQLARTLMEHDLIDEYRLMVFPVVVGKGKRLFGDTQETKAMELVDTRPVGPDGVLILTYRPVSEETSS